MSVTKYPPQLSPLPVGILGSVRDRGLYVNVPEDPATVQ